MYTKEQIRNAWTVANNYGIKYFASVGSNAKTTKSDKLTKYLTLIMYLAPSDMAGAGYNLCPYSSEGCRASCLFSAGHGAWQQVREARILRTTFFRNYKEEFKICLFDEINKHRELCKKLKKYPAIRLNGTSDIAWERLWPELFIYFRDVQFYDYTKTWQRMMTYWKMPKNYHLTFSKSEDNDDRIKVILENNKKANIAVVFDELPKTFMGRKVINGDSHDMRVLDPKGVIVGLTAKGQGKYDDSGFVVRVSNLVEA